MDEIAAIAARYAEAVHRKDAAALVALYDEAAIVFDLWDRWSYQGRAAWAGAVEAWFASLGDERVAVHFTPVLAVVEGDWALWGATVRYAGLDPAGTELRAMANRLSWSLRRRDGAWRIVHEHSSAPADPATLRVMLAAPPA